MGFPSGIVRQHSREFGLLHRLLDASVIVAVLWILVELYDVDSMSRYILVMGLAVISYNLFSEWYSLYRSWRVESFWREAKMIALAWGMMFCVLLVVGFLSKSSIQYSRLIIIAWAGVTPILLIGMRAILRKLFRYLRKQGLNYRLVAIVGSGKSAKRLKDIIFDSPWMGLQLEGVYDNPKFHEGQPLEELMLKIQAKKIDNVYIAYPMREEEKIRCLMEKLADSTVSVSVVPDFFVSDLLQSRWSNLGDVPLVDVYESPFFGLSDLLKRMEDLILGSLILALISPALLVIAVLVRLDSPGPVLFKQRRYGLNGQVIEVWKFRSMCVMEDGAKVSQATKNDPRVTRLGGYLRRTSLDELPQFFNVLQGTMSIVGPRPHAVAHNEEYRKLIHGYMLRHKVRPGITGWAQVNGWRGETDTTQKMQMRVQYDLDYINNWSLWLDLKIIFLTIFGGMRGKSAY